MKYILSIAVLALIVSGCFKTGKVGIEDMQTKWDQTKECMGMPDAEPPALQIEQGDTVQCGGQEAGGCYLSSSQTVLLPSNTDWETVMHEYVHHLCYLRDGARDPNHQCKINGESAYLKCAGVIIDD